MIGVIGKSMIYLAMFSGIAASVLFFRNSDLTTDLTPGKKAARWMWLLMGASAVAAFGLLMYLNATSQFQYDYVRKYTSLDLETRYLISATWAGQEGSFLLWIVLNSFVGIAISRLAGAWEAPVLSIMAVCQVFLISMIIGLDLGAFTLGSNPFWTLIEKFPDNPVIQRGGIPTDGDGLNDLLQNYWMVIHPPMLFTGSRANR